MIKLSGHTIDEEMLPSAPVVLDVGSRNYGFTNAILQIRPEARVVCVEPDPDCVPPVDERITFVGKALVGIPIQSAPYCAYSTGEGNYLDIYPWFNPNPGSPKITVPCITLPELMKECGVCHWDLVKLDCEGAEFDILENWPGVEIADQISVEFHDFTSLFKHNAKYYEALFAKLGYRVRLHGITEIGPGKALGHWDSLVSV